MAGTRLNIKMTTGNLAMGVGFVILGLALFTWLLPLLLPATAIYAIAGAAIGTLVWFLFMLSRQSAE